MSSAQRIIVVTFAAAGFALATVGCQSGGKAESNDHPTAEHKDHPKGEHPKGEHPKGEHPKGEHPK